MIDHVCLKKVIFSRGSRRIFNEIDFSVPKGKMVAIMGPSGTGKTTLLRIISGQLLPDSGQAWVNGQRVDQMSRQELYLIRKKMSMMFQSNALFTNLSVYDNVAYPLRERVDLSEAVIRDVVLTKLEAVGLRGARHLMPHELSGGMARRVAMARAIAMDPELIMYDEPFTGQDPISIGMIIKLMKLLNQSVGMTSIIVSHDIDIVLSIADYAYVIADGKVIGEGTPDVLRNSSSEFVMQFLKGLPDGPVPFHFPAIPYEEDLMQEAGIC